MDCCSAKAKPNEALRPTSPPAAGLRIRTAPHSQKAINKDMPSLQRPGRFAEQGIRKVLAR